MLVDQWMNNPRVGIHRREPPPVRLQWFRERVIRSALVGKLCTATLFRGADYVITGMRKCVCVETAIIMPLRPDPRDAVRRIV